MATIAVIMAMRAEAGQLIDELGAARYELNPSLPTQLFVAERSGDTIVIGVIGVDPDHLVDLFGPQVTRTLEALIRTRPAAGGAPDVVMWGETFLPGKLLGPGVLEAHRRGGRPAARRWRESGLRERPVPGGSGPRSVPFAPGDTA